MVIIEGQPKKVTHLCKMLSHSTNTIKKGMTPTILLQLWVNSRVDWALTFI